MLNTYHLGCYCLSIKYIYICPSFREINALFQMGIDLNGKNKSNIKNVPQITVLGFRCMLYIWHCYFLTYRKKKMHVDGASTQHGDPRVVNLI